jgi:hypothetical protein
MQVRARPTMDDLQTWSFFYGPFLLAAELGTDGMPPSDTGNKWLGLRLNGKADGPVSPAYERVPALVAGDSSKPAPCVKLVKKKPIQFQAPGVVDGTKTSVTLRPLYLVHHQRFAVYLKVGQSDHGRNVKQASADDPPVRIVLVGDPTMCEYDKTETL